MVKANPEKITIFGSNGQIGRYLVKNFSNSYEIIGISRKNESLNNKNQFNKLKLSNFIQTKNFIYPKKIIDRRSIFLSKAIIFTIGKFKNTKNNLDKKINESNFELNYKFLNYLVANHKRFKNNCRIIVITSMNAEFYNLNSVQYCLSKSQLSTAIDNFKVQLKNSRVSIENLMPGPIDTKMRRSKIKSSLSKHDIYIFCQLLINMNIDITLDKIKIFNKKNYFYKY